MNWCVPWTIGDSLGASQIPSLNLGKQQYATGLGRHSSAFLHTWGRTLNKQVLVHH